MRRPKVLITGATGVIGTALATGLERAGYDEVVRVSSADADLTDVHQTEELFKIHSPELVFHLAARVHGLMGNLVNKAQAYVENTRINTNVVDAAQRCGARKIVAMGSTAVYSDAVPLPMTEADVWLGEPHASEAAYAHSKRGMLAQLYAYHEQYDLDFAYCISTNLFGPNDKFDEAWGHVIPSLVSKFHRAAETSTAVTVWGTGLATRDFLYSADAAQALILIAENFTGPINLATGQAHTIAHAVELLTKISGLRSNVIWDTAKPDGQRERLYDISKLKELGFNPAFSLEQGLAETYQWYAENCASARR